MTSNSAEMMTEYVFGNRKVLLDAFQEEMTELQNASTGRSLLNYLPKLKVSAVDITAVLVEDLSVDDLKLDSNEAIEYRHGDLKAKRAVYKDTLVKYLDQLISTDNELKLKATAIPTPKEDVRVKKTTFQDIRQSPVAAANTTGYSKLIKPKGWAKLSGNICNEELLSLYNSVIKPSDPRIEPVSFLSVPFKSQVWLSANPDNASISIVEELRSLRRSRQEDVTAIIDNLTTFSSSADGNFLLNDTSSQQPPVKTIGNSDVPRFPVKVVEILQSISYFQQFKKQDIYELLDEASVVRYNNDEFILHVGSIPSCLYVVLSGSIRVVKPTADSQANIDEFMQMELKIGDVFGKGVLGVGNEDIPSDVEYKSIGDVSVLSIPSSSPFHILVSTSGLDQDQLVKCPPFCLSVTLPNANLTALHHYAEIVLDILEGFDYGYIHGAKFLSTASKRLSFAENSMQDSTGPSVYNNDARRSSRRQSYKVDVTGLTVANEIESQFSKITSRNDSLLDNLSEQVARTLSFEAVQRKRTLMLSLLSCCVPTFDLDSGGLEDFLAIVEEFLEVDRAKYFEINRGLSCALGKHQQTATSSFSICEFPLTGITGHAAKSSCLMNVNNLDGHKLFDKRIDEVNGSKTRQLLCVPTESIYSSYSRVNGILQISNSLDGRLFGPRDELMASLFANLLGLTMLDSASWAKESESISSRAMDKVPFAFTVQNVSLPCCAPNTPVQCLVSLMQNVNQSSAVIASQFLSSATPVININFTVQFPGISIANLSRTCKIRIEFVSKRGQPLGYSLIPMFGKDTMMIRGARRFLVNNGAFTGNVFTPTSIECGENNNNYREFVSLLFPVFDGRPVLHSRQIKLGGSGDSVSSSITLNRGANLDWYLSRMSKAEKIRFDRLYQLPMSSFIAPILDDADRSMIWSMRQALMQSHSLLPLMLLTIDWSNPAIVDEAYQLMHSWQSPDAVQLLQLLGCSFVDPIIRNFASQKFNEFEDDELVMLLPFICKLLAKFESNPDNGLSRQLIMRSLANFHEVGLPLMMLLQSELLVSHNSTVLLPMIELLGRQCPSSTRISLGLQYNVISRLAQSVDAFARGHSLRSSSDANGAIIEFRKTLRDMNADIPELFSLPGCSPERRFEGFVPDASGPYPDRFNPNTFVFRILNHFSDDLFATEETERDVNNVDFNKLRAQDVTTLLFNKTPELNWKVEILARQLVAVCNKCWEMAGLTLFANDLPCFVTADGYGIRYMHTSCRPLSAIAESIRAAGAAAIQNNVDRSTMNEFRKDKATGLDVIDGFTFGSSKIHSETLMKWFTKVGSDINTIVDSKFVDSLAAFCIMNYAFGVTPTSAEDIMITPTGEIFIKDYFSTFLGIVTTTTPKSQKLTPAQQAHIRTAGLTLLPCFAVPLGMPGSQLFRRFEEVFTVAFRVLRRQAKLISTLLTIGLQDIIGNPDGNENLINSRVARFLESMMLELSDEDATVALHKQLYGSLRLYLSA